MERQLPNLSVAVRLLDEWVVGYSSSIISAIVAFLLIYLISRHLYVPVQNVNAYIILHFVPLFEGIVTVGNILFIFGYYK